MARRVAGFIIMGQTKLVEKSDYVYAPSVSTLFWEVALSPTQIVSWIKKRKRNVRIEAHSPIDNRAQFTYLNLKSYLRRIGISTKKGNRGVRRT